MVDIACCLTCILYQEKYIFVLIVGNSASSFNSPAGGPEALFAASESSSGQNQHALNFPYTDTLRPVWSTILTLKAWSNRLTDCYGGKNYLSSDEILLL